MAPDSRDHGQDHASGRAEVACSPPDQDLSAAKRRLALTKARNRNRKARVFTYLAHPQLLTLQRTLALPSLECEQEGPEMFIGPSPALIIPQAGQERQAPALYGKLRTEGVSMESQRDPREWVGHTCRLAMLGGCPW